MTRRRPHALESIAIAIALALPSAAAAQSRAPGWERSVPEPEQTEYDTVTERYGIQILAVDAATVAATYATAEPGVFFGGYFLGGPIVHLINGKTNTAFGSLLMRAGFPMMGLALGAAVADDDCDDDEDTTYCGLGTVAGGIMLGMITASVVDAAVLAKKTTKERREPAAIRYGGVAANPDLRVSKNGSFTFGLTGTF